MYGRPASNSIIYPTFLLGKTENFSIFCKYVSTQLYFYGINSRLRSLYKCVNTAFETSLDIFSIFCHQEFGTFGDGLTRTATVSSR